MPLLEMKSNLSFGAGDQSSEPGSNTGGQTPQLNEQPLPLTSAVFAPVPTRQEIDASVGRARLQSRLVTPTTDLSVINKNFGSNTFTAGNTPSFPHNELNVAPIPTTLYLDKKLDFAPIFSSTNKANNTYNLGNNPTPLQQISTVGINGLVNHAVVPNQYSFTFVPLNNSDNKFPTIAPNTALKSRLYKLHNDGKTELKNNGFTRNGLSLDNYYTKFKIGSNARVGISNQPKVVRGIGQRWSDGVDLSNVTGAATSLISPPGSKFIIGAPLAAGIDTLSSTATSFIEAGIDILSKTASPVFGRNINTFTNRYKADVIRIGKFANPISTYSIKQNFLHRQNKYDRAYTQVMGMGSNTVSDDAFLDTAAGMVTAIAADSGLLDLNPQVFNPLSTFSIPGVPGMMFNRHGRNITDFGAAGNALAEAAGVGAKKLGSKIVDGISTRAIAFAEKRKPKKIAFKGIDFSGGIGGFGGFNLDGLTGGNSVLSGVSGFGLSPDFSMPLPSIKVPKFQKLRELGGSIVDKGIKGAKGAAALATKTQEVAKGLLGDAGKLSKAQLAKLDHRAFEDVGIDKVNLIPYGSTKYKDEEHGTLDHIPFKFVDARTNKPIVFRAILSGITDTFSPEYSPERYVGRPDMVYVYQGTNREISFSFDVYPKSDAELVTLWEKLNYLAGLTYPDVKEGVMIAPFSKLTIGQMYQDAPGYISSLVYTVQDNTTWEVDFAKLPKYIQVACSFIYIGDRMPSSTQKHFDVPWVASETYIQEKNLGLGGIGSSLLEAFNSPNPSNDLGDVTRGLLGKVGL